MENKLTIVIPCKNEVNYIGHLLDSLKSQEGLGNTKIYIADASTDLTRYVIDTNKDHLNIEIIEGGPVSIAKNNGARLVRTPYVLFIDADVRFFSNTVIKDTLSLLEDQKLDLIGLKIKCYDSSIRSAIAFGLFNITNKVLARWMPFAVGAFMLTRMDKFKMYGGFPNKYPTSEDFFLSKKYSPKKFLIADHYFGQDSRRFNKMGYFGMAKYLLINFLNRNNESHWKKINAKKYW